jgi:iron complex outermembrane receptor protein
MLLLPLLLLCVLPRGARADARDDARRYFKSGMSLVAEGKHEEGAEKLLRAYEILPHPNVLYNVGLAYADAGRYDDAAYYFQKYLESEPADGAAVERLLQILKQQAAEARGAAPGGEPGPGAGAEPGGAGGAEAGAESAGGVPAAGATVSSPQLDALVARLEALAERLEMAPGAAPGAPVAVAPTEDAVAPEVLEQKSGDIYEEVVVSASRQATAPADAPAATTIITAEEIRLSGASNLPDLLRRVPGISILTMGAGNANLAMRGFNQRISNKLLTLVDGRNTYLDFLGGSFHPTFTIDLRDIERIEIIRGPGSTLYGANAFGGVVNIITKAPGADDGGQVFVSGGSGNTLQGNLQWSGRKGIFGWRGSLGYEQTDRYEREFAERADYAPTTDDVDLALRAVRANGAVRIVPGPKTSIGISGGINHVYDNFFAIGLFRDFQMRALVGDLRTDVRLGGLSVRAFWNSFRAEAAPTWQPVGGLDLSTDPVSHVVDVEAAYNGSATLGPVRQDFAVGGGYRLKTIDWSYLDGPHTEQHLSGFLEDRITFVPQLVAVVGFRFDQHPLVGFTPSPRGAVLVKPTPGQALRISAGTAFRTPTFLESYLDLVVPTGVVTGVGVRSLGNTDLEPENIFSVEGGYVFAESDYIGFELAGWYQRVSNLIALGRIQSPETPEPLDGDVFIAGTSQWENAPGVFHGGGGEAELHAFPLDGLDLRGSYSFAYFWDQAKKDAGEADFRDKRHPMHTGNVGASYKSPIGLDLNVDLHLVSAVEIPERAFDADGNVIVEACEAPAYAMVSARLGWRLLKDRLELGLTAFNIGGWRDGGHREHCFGTKVGPRLLGSAALRW